MQKLTEMLEYMKNYANAVEKGIEVFEQTYPTMIRQHMNTLAGRKLNSTKDVFMSAVKTKTTDHVIVVELDKDNFMANAVESGMDPFNMKETHLKSKKAKTSKAGYKYMSIPIGKSKDDKPGTDKGKEFQAKIMDVLHKPKFGAVKMKMQMNGSVSVSQLVDPKGTDLGGFYRIQEFASVEDFNSKKKPFKTSFVLFRTISENPNSKSTWNHPGIAPANIFRQTESWITGTLDPMLEEFIMNELKNGGLI
jgi:hypothetical protein